MLWRSLLCLEQIKNIVLPNISHLNHLTFVV